MECEHIEWKRAYRESIRKMMVPHVFRMLLLNSFTLVDTIMISGLGDEAIAAIGAVGQVNFVMGMMLGGVYAMSTFITQFFGNDDMENCKKTLGLMLMTSVIISSITMILVYIFRFSILQVFLEDNLAKEYGLNYLNVIILVYVVNAIKDSYFSALSAIGKVKISLIIGGIGMIINTGLNYVLIYGVGQVGGELGTQGAAIATFVSAMVSMVILLIYVYGKGYYFDAKIKELFSFDRLFAKKVYKVSLPLILHEGLWSFGNMLYAVAFSHIGLVALSAYQLIKVMNRYFRIGISGVAYTAKVMIGKRLTKEDPAEAIYYAQKFTKLSIKIALIMGGIVFVAAPNMSGIFPEVSAEVKRLFIYGLRIQALMMIVYFLNNHWIVGVFRAGGDNIFTTKMIFFTTWLVALPLVCVGTYILKLDFEVIYILYTSEEIVKMIIGFYRYNSKKWVNNLVADIT